MIDDDCSSPDSDCSKVLAELMIYLDGELDEVTAADFQRHLGACNPCRDTADLEACVRDLLRSRCADKAPASLVSRLEATLTQLQA